MGCNILACSPPRISKKGKHTGLDHGLVFMSIPDATRRQSQLQNPRLKASGGKRDGKHVILWWRPRHHLEASSIVHFIQTLEQLASPMRASLK